MSFFFVIRLESRKKGEPKKSQIQTEELSALQKRLEEKKQQRLRSQEASKITPNAKSSARTKNLITQKVSFLENICKFIFDTIFFEQK